ncbi:MULTISPECIES: ABC transporter substrate-binding protein [unclassified Streptomyces]|uniref:ABC transporter substrate-binding protein n=1 Tax=unclassified Streptomyces TaxID=2593676 RepID=UPI00382917B9|nr:sugar ABC transporter substrate-binding protein [Streptomyces sp. NBC_01014]
MRTPTRSRGRNRVRTAVTALAAAAALTFVAGCGSGSGDSSSGRITLQFLSLAWQKDSVAANKALVDEWNKQHPDVRVKYVQGSWDGIHDQLLTSFEGGQAPDIIHDDASDLTDFAYGGYLADLRTMLPKSLKEDIPQQSWGTTTFDGGVYGVPFLQEPRVLVANTKLLKASGVRIPTAAHPWSWSEFQQVSKRLTVQGADGRTKQYGVAWSMKEPVTQSVNGSVSTGGKIFERVDGKNKVSFDAADSAVAQIINRQINQDHTAPKSSLGMGGADTLPGFFAGKYAMVPVNFSYRQQIEQQAPKGFGWTVLPLPAGSGPEGRTQGVVPQTLSVSQDSRHKQAAVDFISFLTQGKNAARLALGDWLLPNSRTALKDPALNTPENGWRTGSQLFGELVPSPVLGVRGYAEWKDKIATPAFQEYYNGSIGLGSLRSKLAGDGQRVLDRYQR